MKMPFGKYRGVNLEEIPQDYLLWTYENINFRSKTLKCEIESILNISSHEDDSKGKEDSISAAEIETWLSRMARRYHPDRGGTNEQMQAVMEGYHLLKEILKQNT